MQLSLDAGPHRLRGGAPGLNHLGVDHRLLLLCAPPLQQLLRLGLSARGTPVLETVAQGEREGKTGFQPQAKCSEGERGGEIESHGNGADANQVSADQVKEMDEDIGGDASQQAFHGNGVQPAPVPGQQSEKGGGKDEQGGGAEHARNRRLDLSRTKPANAEQAEKHRNQERGDPGELELKVAAVGADDADPVA